MNEVATEVFDLSPVLQVLGGLLVAVLLALATFAVNWVRVKIGLGKLEQDEVIRNYLEQVIEAAVAHAMGKVPDKLNKDSMVRTALAYVLRSVPDALAHFGIDEERLYQIVEVRLNQYLPEPKDESDTGSGADGGGGVPTVDSV